MNFKINLEDRARNALLESILVLLEKDPKKNLSKIMKLSKLLVNDKTSKAIIASLETSYNEVSSFKSYLDELIINTDYSILKNFVVNIVGKNLSKNNSTEFINENIPFPHSMIINSCNTLTLSELDKIISTSQQSGIFTFIILGNNTFSSNYFYDIFDKHKDVLFVPITDGSKVTDINCNRLLKSCNVIPLLKNDSNSNFDILKRKGIPFSSIKYIQTLLKDTKLVNKFCDLKTFHYDNSTLNQMLLNEDTIMDILQKNSI